MKKKIMHIKLRIAELKAPVGPSLACSDCTEICGKEPGLHFFTKKQ